MYTDFAQLHDRTSQKDKRLEMQDFPKGLFAVLLILLAFMFVYCKYRSSVVKPSTTLKRVS
jgi:hypothetical protein